MLLALMPMCFIACSSDDESGTDGLTTENLIGDWKKQNSGVIWSFNSDGTWNTTEGTHKAVYTNWSISDGKLMMTRRDGRVEAYTAEIKDGLLYTYYDRESNVFERYDRSQTVNVTSEYFVGTWEAAGGSAYGTWVFKADGKCNFSYTTGRRTQSLDGTWTYTPLTKN